MRIHPTPASIAATLCAAFLFGVAATTTGAAAPPNPAQSGVAKITQGMRTFVPGGAVMPLPADLVPSVRVSYDQAGTIGIDSGPTSGTYTAHAQRPGWVHVTVRNMGTINGPDGKPQSASFGVLVEFVNPKVQGSQYNPMISSVVFVPQDFTYTEQIKGGGTWKYDFYFDPYFFKLTSTPFSGSQPITLWYPMTVKVKVDTANRIRESNEGNNDFTYTVHFTD
ncbi:MAG TPA: hypothetical protein VMT19_11230 [Thermoanaerobaculaceae bacterium]|nr:hypothetical protein [Thermoanaerobaculaceae bacterium]